MIFRKKLILGSRLFLILCFFVFSFTQVFSTEVLKNTGFVQSGIWYSKEPFFEGDKIRIYSILFNGSDSDILGQIVFEDNGKAICKGDFVSVRGRTQELWCDWTATKGEHKIVAKIIDPQVSPIGGKPYPIILKNNISGVSEVFVDKAEPPSPALDINKDKKEESLSTTTNQVEEKFREKLDTVGNGVLSVAPKEIKKEDIEETKNKILSYVPEIVKEKFSSASSAIGADKLKEPLSRVVDFLITLYKFIINDPLLIIIIGTYVIWKIMKYIYKKTMRPY